MALYDRLIGRDDAGNPVANKIPIHVFQATVGCRRRGNIATDADAQAVILATSGATLLAAELTELQTLLATVPLGNTTQNQLDRLRKLQEIDQILLLADARAPGFDTPTLVKGKLGV
jgi:hypothetical protein